MGVLLLALLCCSLPSMAQEDAAPAAVEQPSITPVQVAVLGYGGFASGVGMPGITATTFLAQMTYLKEQGITPVSLNQFIRWHRGEESLPERSVLITLDEADISTYAVAYPVLKEYGFPFVVFADGRNLQQKGAVLSPARLNAMRRAGASIGSCSMTRPQACDWVFASESGPEASFKLAERELGVSAQRITAYFGSCEAFSYPRGYANADMMENLAIYGYRVAFGRREGKVLHSTPAYMLNRYMVRDMEAFARAVNFGAPEQDSAILQQVRSVADRHGSESPTVEIVSPGNGLMDAVMSGVNTAAVDAVQPPLPPVVELDPTSLASAPQPVQEEPEMIPVQEEEAETPVADLKDPVLQPRPVSQLPAAGALEKRECNGDWVTREFSQPLVPREQTRVAVLGYHDFSNTRPATEMCLRTAEFCQQMQYIQDAGIAVITMQDFREWLLGERCLPERCVLITIDDGWINVHTEAFPILKAYKYPFTLYLYTDFLGGKGLSMAHEQIREMMSCGATVGSHSASHPYPSKWKALAPDSPEYAELLQKEIPDSISNLRNLFGVCSTFCYPGGYHTPQMQDSLRAHGVEMAFTVIEKKVTTQTNPLLVNRYMVFGNDPRIFRRAVNFDDVAGVKPTAQGITEARERARAFFPKAFEKLGTLISLPEDDAPLPPAVMTPQQPSAAPVLEDIPAPEYTQLPQ
ncbi:MAG: polysaccharide deacetylase family protein [Akkermansia sp.]|nr:polysaccharide deacetylase family protein [Akkermansia sp.]